MASSFEHTPVLFEECMDALDIKPGGTYVDGTLGGGGHASGIAERIGPNGTLIGIDRDQEALDAAAEVLKGYPCRKILIKARYSQIKEVLRDTLGATGAESTDIKAGTAGIDGALLDVGVSSHQLDSPNRGFSYQHDTPLDMRMDRDASFTAWDVVNTYDEGELARIIKEYGEERWAKRIAAFVKDKRKEAPIETTGQLVDIIKAAIPASARREGPHPAKRTFQAIRIEVNDELGELKKACDDYCDVLRPGGRLCIITFHSLEDRIVKEAFATRLDPCICPKDLPVCVCGRKPDVRKVTGKPVTASEEELNINPRSRSAKMRAIEKL
jgi:16S rRNA (cytosine1402-N4)-methyltransferase